jgi:hypothetical protein
MTLATVNGWLVFAIPVVMILFGGISKGLIAGFKLEAFALGLESTLVAFTECLNRIRMAHTLHASDSDLVTLVGLLLLLGCIVILGILIAIHRGMSDEGAGNGAGVARPWYLSPWLWLVGVGNVLGGVTLVGVLHLMRDSP